VRSWADWKTHMVNLAIAKIRFGSSYQEWLRRLKNIHQRGGQNGNVEEWPGKGIEK